MYGRRKVGKTFTLRRCLSYDLYVIVTRSGEVLVEDGVWSLESAVREVAKVLRRGGVAVVDEFQRMPRGGGIS